MVKRYNMPTSCQWWVWEIEAPYINWYMVTCKKATLVRNYLLIEVYCSLMMYYIVSVLFLLCLVALHGG